MLVDTLKRYPMPSPDESPDTFGYWLRTETDALKVVADVHLRGLLPPASVTPEITRAAADREKELEQRLNQEDELARLRRLGGPELAAAMGSVLADPSLHNEYASFAERKLAAMLESAVKLRSDDLVSALEDHMDEPGVVEAILRFDTPRARQAIRTHQDACIRMLADESVESWCRNACMYDLVICHDERAIPLLWKFVREGSVGDAQTPEAIWGLSQLRTPLATEGLIGCWDVDFSNRKIQIKFPLEMAPFIAGPAQVDRSAFGGRPGRVEVLVEGSGQPSVRVDAPRDRSVLRACELMRPGTPPAVPRATSCTPYDCSCQALCPRPAPRV